MGCQLIIIGLYIPIITEANLSRHLQVHKISSFIPCMLINSEGVLEWFDGEWTILKKCSIKSWASRPTMEPDDEWIFCFIFLWGEIDIMNFMIFKGADFEISWDKMDGLPE